MRRPIIISKRLLAFCLALLLLAGAASAEGLFPSMNQLFGTAMPSIEVLLGRSANEAGENENGKYEVYSPFSYDDYTAFGAYLAGAGAALKDTSVKESTITAELSARGASMQFTYDWSSQTATAVYPSGTRPETEQEAVENRASILPPVGGIMPSAQFAVDRNPDREDAAENGITQVWEKFTEDDYYAFSSYLARTGAVVTQSSAEAGILTAEISLNSRSFTFTYDWHTKAARVFYPSGTSPEREMWNTLKGNGSILPAMDTVGRELPSMSQALSRLPDAEEDLPDGSRSETYTNFSEEDYSAFSQYLLASDCKVDDYRVEDGSVMVIRLSNITGTFTFTYDALRHIGTVVYPKSSRVEAAWVAPTATPKPAATVTSKPSQSYYSEYECWNTAEKYFKNMSWKNPSSVTIHSHTATYDAGDNTYTFYIDYSAQNGFGGYNRSYYFITVNAATGRVTSAFGGN